MSSQYRSHIFSFRLHATDAAPLLKESEVSGESIHMVARNRLIQALVEAPVADGVAECLEQLAALSADVQALQSNIAELAELTMNLFEDDQED